MTNNSSIQKYIRDLRPVRPRSCPREACFLLALACAEVGALFLLGANRMDLSSAVHLYSFWWKVGCFGAITMLGSLTTLRSLDPTHSPRHGLIALLGLIGGALLWDLAINASQAHVAALTDRLMWKHGLHCILAMLALSTPLLLALAVLIRQGAPTDRPGTVIAASATSAAWGAFVFAFRCPYDDPVYLAAWYGLGFVVVGSLSHLVLSRASRW